jgi:maltooligosyltrehalose trehalohydrolase
LLCPHIPLIFIGEEDASTTPFQFFTDHHGELADAVREGRRREFAGFAAFADPQRRASIPDPNATITFDQSRPEADAALASSRRELYRHLLDLRRDRIVPVLAGARALGATVIDEAAVVARWRMSDGAILTIATNLGPAACRLTAPSGELLFAAGSAGKSAQGDLLEGHTTVAFLETSRG